jgi:4-oxalocrotonate tautomerase
MPLVQVTMIEGRSQEKKEALIREVTDAVARTADAPLETIRVILYEVPAGQWGVGGVSKAK